MKHKGLVLLKVLVWFTETTAPEDAYVDCNKTSLTSCQAINVRPSNYSSVSHRGHYHSRIEKISIPESYPGETKVFCLLLCKDS